MDDPNLELVPTAALIEEFFRRHDSCMFVVVPHGSKDGAPTMHYKTSDQYQSCGMLLYAIARVILSNPPATEPPETPE